MELGEKLLLTRQEAGLSQRQLCDGIITRNMLSQIEHGTARPSMDTLRKLAARLGKPVSWFLDEEAALSPNQNLMCRAEAAYRAEDFAQVLELLKEYQSPEALFDRQMENLRAHAALREAEKSAASGKHLYARQLLEKDSLWTVSELERSRLLLLAALPGGDAERIAARLPSLDDELLLRAEAALRQNQPEKAMHLLEAAEDHSTHRWQFLRGKTQMALGQFSAAAELLQSAEGELPEACAPLLEICFRELGDFQQAYLYACRQKK